MPLPKIHAPFTSEQIEKLKTYQHSGGFHPFTCPREHAGDESMDLELGKDAWRCPGLDPDENPCTYTQQWAYEFMLDPGLFVNP